MTEKIRVFVADDHPVFRDGLAQSWLEHPQILLVGEADDGFSALDQIARGIPDVAIVDYKLPGLDGLEVLQELSHKQVSTGVIILTAYVDRAVVLKAFAHGARGFLEKVASVNEITDAVLRVAEGQTVMAGYAQEVLAKNLRDQREFENAPPLTRREREIIQAAANGDSNALIAEKLHISVSTVKTHLQHVYEKLSVGDRSAAVAQAVRRGLLD